RRSTDYWTRVHACSSSLTFFSRYPPHRALHSFPTRRSSDLFGASCCAAPGTRIMNARRLIRSPRRCARAGRSAGRFQEPSIFLRSEEHTSELQSRFDLVCRLLLEKKKNIRLRYLFTTILPAQ